MFEHIPRCITDCPQWLIWRAEPQGERTTKVPYVAETGYLIHAAVDNPTTWRTFEQAAHAMQIHNASGIGFVFGGQSGLCGIDCDKCINIANGQISVPTVERMVEAFSTYTEFSPSWSGLHLIIEANIPGGHRRDGIELYGDKRFFTFTGNSFHTPALDVANGPQTQTYAELLYCELAQGKNLSSDISMFDATEEIRTDEAVLERCFATYGDKFAALWKGDWSASYPSQSQADQALVNYLQFWSRYSVQISRLFLMSGLGQRPKAQKRRETYVMPMVRKSFDLEVRRPKLIDIMAPPSPQWSTPAQTSIAAPAETVQPPPLPAPAIVPVDPFQPPPGLVGDIARFILSQSKYPMPAASILGALALMGGICGRQFQISNTGLNLYLLLLAPTGSGKDAMTTGVSALHEAICQGSAVGLRPGDVPIPFVAARDFRGPADVTGKGLLNSLARSGTKSQVIFGQEWTHKFTALADPRNRNEGDRQLKRIMLDLYMKSGANDTYAGIMTAEKERDVKELKSPSFTLLAEGTPARFYSDLTEHVIEDGLLPRFVIVESEMGTHNPGHANVKPPSELVDQLRNIARFVLENMTGLNDRRQLVSYSEQDAELLSEDFREWCHAKVREYAKAQDAFAQMWNRAHLNMLRIAALVAVGVDHHEPKITPEIIQWAKIIVVHAVQAIVSKFERAEIGADIGAKQQAKLVSVVAHYYDRIKTNTLPQSFSKFAQYGLIPRSYIQQYCRGAVFASYGYKTSQQVFDEALRTLMKTGQLKEVQFLGEKTIKELIGTDQPCYRFGEF